MRPALPWLLAIIAATALPVEAAAAPVLGVEAAPTVRKWVQALQGLRTGPIRIDGDRVSVPIGDGGCTLELVHASAAACADGRSVGSALACVRGEGCPSATALDAAFGAAGTLELPWRDPAGAAESDARATLLADLDQLRRHLEVGERTEARALLNVMLTRPQTRAREWTTLMPLTLATGGRQEAFRMTEGTAREGLDPLSLALLRVLLVRGADTAAAVAPATLDGRNACGLVTMAVALQWIGRHEPAGRIALAARRADPSCFEAYRVESESWSVLGRTQLQRDVAEAALARFPGHERLAEIEEPFMITRGDGDVVLHRLEERLRGGDRSPGLLKRLLSFYIAVEGRPARLRGLVERVAKAPEDRMAAFFAGVLMHYERDYAASQAYLLPLVEIFPKEPRLYIYLAMNAFNLGELQASKDYIARAETLDLRDPDVPYCTAEIYRDTDRARALRAMDAYLTMTSVTADPHSTKERRVRAMRDAIARCESERTPPPCPGPWEHTFDSVRVGRNPMIVP
ncbi:MAG: hypothetical protein R3F39_05195 [Myxococcota bacterium]